MSTAVMKCLRCGDQITSENIQAIIDWDKNHKESCTKKDGPVLKKHKIKS